MTGRPAIEAEIAAHLQDSLSLHIGRVRETVSRPQHGGWFRPPELHLLQVVTGSFDIEHPDCGRQVLRPGHALVVCPAVRYFVRIRSPDAATIRYAHVHLGFFQTLPLTDVADLPALLPPPLGRPLGDAIAACERRLRDRDAGDLASLTAATLATATLAHEIVRHARFHEQGRRLLRGALRLRPVIDHMRQHLHHALTRHDLAAVAGLSPSRFSGVFARDLGESPMRFLQALRLHAARRELLATGATVKSIAERYQFSDAFHFSKAFKARYGISPSSWIREATRFVGLDRMA